MKHQPRIKKGSLIWFKSASLNPGEVNGTMEAVEDSFHSTLGYERVRVAPKFWDGRFRPINLISTRHISHTISN